MRDGDVDYSKYTRRELEEAFAGIDGMSYPANLANLQAAYKRKTGKAFVKPGEGPPPSWLARAWGRVAEWIVWMFLVS